MLDRGLVRLVRLHYFLGVGTVSSRRFTSGFTRQTSLALAFSLASAALWAQYPGQVAKKAKDTAELRAVAVLEWTGDEGKPKTSRLVPITVYDGEALQDGNVYLARPQPLALAGEVEYVLEQNGKPIGLYDIKRAGQEEGLWVGYGTWKPMPSAKPAPPRPIIDTGFDAEDDKPVLHRRHSSDSGSRPDSGGSSSPASGPSPDPDRPTLHKKTGSDDSSSSNSSSGAAPNPDQPTLHKEDSSSASDTDRPVLHKHDEASSSAEDGKHSGLTDPDRPHLVRGKPTGDGLAVLPSLMGLPAEMRQAVAVSDAKSRPEHRWSYTWANPDDEERMKEAMETIARDALGPRIPPPPAAPKRASARSRANAAPPPEPPPLVDENFRVFELAYGTGATMVFSAHTDGPPKEQKFVTLIAQPDLYGNPLVLLKNVTDGAHLDETPRMRLVDAVDAMADNRGELLFELRGAAQRQFALYRVLRGAAERIFVTVGADYGVAPGE
jgi:hypothetical protein